MKLSVVHQQFYSRAELLVRSLFGLFYIALPHGFLLLFLGIASGVLQFLSFWIVLFTGRYPESFFEFQAKLIRWGVRIQASLAHLVDGFPPFGLDVDWEKLRLDIPYPEKLSRSHLLMRTLFGWIYFSLPHGFCLAFRMLWTGILGFLAWWVVLFTGSYPQSWHEFNVGTIRWMTRMTLYEKFMTDDYPPFSGRALDDAEWPPLPADESPREAPGPA